MPLKLTTYIAFLSWVLLLSCDGNLGTRTDLDPEGDSEEAAAASTTSQSVNREETTKVTAGNATLGIPEGVLSSDAEVEVSDANETYFNERLAEHGIQTEYTEGEVEFASGVEFQIGGDEAIEIDGNLFLSIEIAGIELEHFDETAIPAAIPGAIPGAIPAAIPGAIPGAVTDSAIPAFFKASEDPGFSMQAFVTQIDTGNVNSLSIYLTEASDYLVLVIPGSLFETSDSSAETAAFKSLARNFTFQSFIGLFAVMSGASLRVSYTNQSGETVAAAVTELEEAEVETDTPDSTEESLIPEDSESETEESESDTAAPSVEEDTTLPSLIASLTPANGTTSVSLGESIYPTFTEEMVAESLTTNTDDTSCSGSIQLSSDNFSTCVKMGNQPTAIEANTDFYVTPAANLRYDTNYKIRITSDIISELGSELSEDYTTSDGFTTEENPGIYYGWTKTFGGSSYEFGNSIAIDASGNIFATGYFQDTVDFDSSEGTDEHTSNGYYDIFITKLNADGTYGWTKTFGGSSYDYGISIAIAIGASGNIFTTGYFHGTVDFDSSEATDEHTSTSNGGEDIFITKLNADGTYGWTKTLGGSSSDYGYSIATDSDGNVFATGNFYGTVDFDSLTGEDSHTSNGSNDIFIMKLNASDE
jgi:hypothetical protein